MLTFTKMNRYHPYTIFPLGDHALTIEFGDCIEEETNKKLLALYAQLKKENFPFVHDIVPAYSALTLHYDLSSLREKIPEELTVFEFLAEKIEAITARQGHAETADGVLHEVPVCYAPAYGLDVDFISDQKNISADDLVRLHTERTYRVYMIGFLPGFPYLAEVDEKIAIGRKASPRTKLPAGSVGIAGKQTGIYPFESPGGWQIIGRTPVSLFHPGDARLSLFRPGDTVKFYSISEDEFLHYQAGNL